MITLSIVTANPARWPGVAAVLPVLGTVLVLLAQRHDSWLTAPAVLQRLGDWSYSIYLWHWPVAVALAYAGWQGQGGLVLAGMALSLGLGWASYRWAEPLGRKRLARWPTLPALAAVAVASTLVALPALLVRLQQGVPGRLSPRVEAMAAAVHDANPLREQSHSMGGAVFKKHVYGGPNIRAVVWGDSHASAIVTAVQAALPSPQDGVLGMSYTSCPTLFGVRQSRADLHCADFNEWALQQVASLPANVPVIIANRGAAYLYGNAYGAHQLDPAIYFDSYPRTPDGRQGPFLLEFSDRFVASACRIAAQRPVYLLRPLPEMPADVPRAMARAAQLGRTPGVAMPLATYHQRNAALWVAQDRAGQSCGVHILDPLPSLCRNDACQGADGDMPRYYDDNHLSETGNRRLVPLFAAVLQPPPASAEPQVAQTHP